MASALLWGLINLNAQMLEGRMNIYDADGDDDSSNIGNILLILR